MFILNLLKSSKYQYNLERLPLKTHFPFTIHVFILYFLKSHWLLNLLLPVFFYHFTILLLTFSDCQINVLFQFPLIWAKHFYSSTLLSAGSLLALWLLCLIFLSFLSLKLCFPSFCLLSLFPFYVSSEWCHQQLWIWSHT